MKQIKFTLKNKLKVILIPSHKSPVISVQMWVKTGSADEKKREEGISHFIEHLVFKGTQKYKVGEIANIVEASGGELNAYTSFDQTVFYVTISKNYSDVALDVISEMMGFPLFDAAEVHSEREVVCEEIKMGTDSAQRTASQLMFSSIFKKHAYGIPVIGYEKNVRGWPVKKIKNFYQSRYVPSNMALVVSGDFEPVEMKNKISELYSNFVPYPFRKVKRVKEPAQTKSRFAVKTKKQSERFFQLAVPAPNIKHKDLPAMDILAMVLGQGETSRLVTALRLEKPLVNSISAYNYNPQDSGLFAVSIKYTDQSEKDIFKTLFEQIEIIKKNGISWDELKKSILNISSEQFYSIETVDGIANKVGSSQFYMDDSFAHEKYLKKIQKVTPEQVKKIAKKYLVAQKGCYSLMSELSDAQNKKIILDAEKQWKTAIKAASEKKAEKIDNKKIKIPKIEFKQIKKSSKQEVEVFKTAKGTEILFLNNKEIPTTSAKIIFGGGARIESPTKMGTTELLIRTLLTKTKNFNENEILKKIESAAAGLSPFGGKNTIGFSVDYMKPFESEMLKLTGEVVNFSEFNSEPLAREKDILQKQILSKEDQPSFLCGRQFVKSIFPNHPISYEQSGTPETLQNISNLDIGQLFKKIKAHSNMQVAVVGDFNKDKWVDLVTNMESHFTTTGKLLKPVSFEKLKENKKLFLEKDKEQSHVIIGWQALGLSDPDRYTLQAIQAVMAGQGGRLFYELRDKSSLAYSVSPIKMESLETGYFGGYIACSPDKVEKAIEMFKIEFQKISEKQISSEELSRAKKYLIGQHDIGLQRKSSICNLIAFDHFYGNSFQESLDVADCYNKITQEGILKLSQRLFSEPNVISVVGRKEAG